MGDRPSKATQDPNQLLHKLQRGFKKRRDLPGGFAREALDAHILKSLTTLASRWVPKPVESLDRTPPRAVAVAMAMACQSQPHLAQTFGRERATGTEDVGDVTPRAAEQQLTFHSDVLCAALGLPRWELDEIREEVDRNIARRLKARRALRWLWNRFNPTKDGAEPLFRLLFPGAQADLGSIGLIRRGCQLYAVVDMNPVPPTHAMHLGWTTTRGDRCFPPLGTFRGKYVDAGLRRALGRAIGAGDLEVLSLLDSMVTVVPRQDVTAFLAEDTWRAGGASWVTGLGDRYASSAWLSKELSSPEVAWDPCIARTRNGATLRSARQTFDHLAVPRVATMLRQVYSAILSGVTLETPGSLGRQSDLPRSSDVDAYDFGQHIKRVTEPLMRWAELPDTAQHVSTSLAITEEQASQVLAELAREWQQQLEHGWCASPRDFPVRSVQTLLTSHTLAIRTSLRRLYHRPADHRGEHRTLLLLFTGHYFADAALERLWSEANTNETWPPARPVTIDTIGEYFWGTWQRLLAARDAELDSKASRLPAASTFAPPE